MLQPRRPFISATITKQRIEDRELATQRRVDH